MSRKGGAARCAALGQAGASRGSTNKRPAAVGDDQDGRGEPEYCMQIVQVSCKGIQNIACILCRFLACFFHIVHIFLQIMHIWCILFCIFLHVLYVVHIFLHKFGMNCIHSA